MEIERKYLDANLGEVRARLAKIAVCGLPEHFEANVIFDTSEHSLLRSGRLLRLRTMDWGHKKTTVLTYKAPPRNDFSGENVKVKEEIETVVNDGAAMRAILENLGFEAVGYYEKFREDWKIGSGCVVSLDLLPFGKIVEVEAPPEEQDSLASELGLDKLETSIKSYYEIYEERQTGATSPVRIEFEKPVKAAHMARLGIS